MTAPEPDPCEDPGGQPISPLAAAPKRAKRPNLGAGRSIYAASAGDCGGCLLEVQMLRSAAYSLEQHGFTVLDSPVGADILLVTGAMTRSLAAPIRRALEAMSEPCWVVAFGDCAHDGGPFASSAVIAGGAQSIIPVDLVVPGCPPTPATLLAALQSLLRMGSA